MLGERRIPVNALFGIHAQRASENFPLSGRRVHPALIRAYGHVKQAALQANFEGGYIEKALYNMLSQACDEMAEGLLNEHIIVDAIQGGAGTSTNMNVNEVLSNRALQLLGREPGRYDIVHPIEHVNLHQSTNDTYPTALKVAAVQKIHVMEKNLIALTERFQDLEKSTAHLVKIGRTQLQDAVLTTMGRSMGAYAEATGRDRWRIYKCGERLRVVNLGGTAIGTGLGAPRSYIFSVVEHLNTLTGGGFSRAENMVDNTQNVDVFVEVSGILSACASNLIKISNDLRLLSSGPETGFREIHLPERQAGSSIMPSKINPVIPEAVIQCGLRVNSNHQSISTACSLGNLELNAFLPFIADCLLESLDLLSQSARILSDFCIDGLKINETILENQIAASTATITALIHVIGYDKARDLARKAAETNVPVRDVILESGLLTADELAGLTAPEAVTRLGTPEHKGKG